MAGLPVDLEVAALPMELEWSRALLGMENSLVWKLKTKRGSSLVWKTRYHGRLYSLLIETGCFFHHHHVDHVFNVVLDLDHVFNVVLVLDHVLVLVEL